MLCLISHRKPGLGTGQAENHACALIILIIILNYSHERSFADIEILPARLIDAAYRCNSFDSFVSCVLPVIFNDRKKFSKKCPVVY